MNDLPGSLVIRFQKSGITKDVQKLSTIEKLLSLLTEREEQIVRRRHGIGPFRAHTLVEVGTLVGLSAARVSQIELKAIRRLRWVIHHTDIEDEEAILRLLKKRADAVEKEREMRNLALVAKAQEANQKRVAKNLHDKQFRAEVRERHLQQAETQQKTLKAEFDAIQIRLSRIERRGWFARTFLPHKSKLILLLARAEQLQRSAGKVSTRLERLRGIPPRLRSDEEG